MKQYFSFVLLFSIALMILACNSSSKNSADNSPQQVSPPFTANTNPLIIKNPSIIKDMQYIPPGEFIMGSEDEDANFDEKPAHNVFLNAFYIDKFEVTNSQYQQFVKQTGHPAPFMDAEWALPYNWHGISFPDGMAQFPVVLVSWEDATAYAQWAGKRLPTEAEWEKAARGGLVSQKYPFGKDLEIDHANFYKGFMRDKSLKPVGSFKLGGFGLYDMAGNVWEWCQDWYDEKYYKVSSATNPQGPAESLYRVMRGGCWVNDKNYLRCAQRSKNVPESKSHLVGFRCALSAERDTEVTSTMPRIPDSSPVHGGQSAQTERKISVDR